MVPRAPPPGQTLRPPPPERGPSVVSKTSIFSVTPSNEADDERSVSGSSLMGPQPERGYPGEDRRSTSTKELAGFYAYGWAAEVFVVCGIGSFIPITLEQLARERGVLLSDHTTPCKAGLHASASPRAEHAATSSRPHEDAEQCVIYFLGMEINTASFAMYTFSLSVLIQALLIISMSGAADHGRYRKTLLLAFAFTGAVASMLFLPVVPQVYVIGAFLAVVANTCVGASFVLLNSFLPLLVRYHPSVQDGDQSGAQEPYLGTNDQDTDEPSSLEERSAPDDLSNSRSGLLSDRQSEHHQLEVHSAVTVSQELDLSTKISAYGMGIGYIAAVFVQTLSIFVILLTGSSLFSLRLVLFIVGAWWFAFTIPAAVWLRPRPGPPLRLDESSSNTRLWLAYFSYSWRSLGRSAMRARRLKDVLLFLGAWFLLSDSIATVSGTAVLFAKTSLGMKPAALAMINVIATLFGVAGAFGWSRISTALGLRPHHTILACICLFELIPLYGLLGYVPAIRRLGVFGLQQPWEMYPLGAIYGFVLGGLSSYCRSLFGELIPPGSEAAFYALYAITDKGSSMFGPAIVGAITDATGEIRPAFWFLAALIALPFPLMYFVNVERGRAEGIALAKEIEEQTSQAAGSAEEGDREERTRIIDEDAYSR